jgi:hypothetical protein
MQTTWYLALTVLGASTSCQVIAPPPTVALHASTGPDQVDATTVMVIVGGMGQYLFGGTGLGLAVRVERQARNDLAIGIDMTGGLGRTGDLEHHGHWLLALRSYGRYATPQRPWLAATGGAALSVMDTGMVSVTPHIGAAIGQINDDVVTTLQLSSAVSVPLRRGDEFQQSSNLRGEVRPGKRPTTTWYWLADLGFWIPLGATRNAVSIDLGVAKAYGTENSLMLIPSVADQQRFGR